MGLWKRKTKQGKQTKDQRPKNKIIIIGEYGSGKSYKALNLMSDKKGTCIICNGSVSISTYKANFPTLGDYAEESNGQCFPVEQGGKYYLRTTSGNPSLKFVDALIHGCDYGYIGDDENATVLYDDGAWSSSDNNVVTFWQLSHAKCGIIITANTLCDVLKLKETELTEEMIEDVKKYWCIKDLAVTGKDEGTGESRD